MDGWECLLKWFCGIKLVVHSHNMEGLRWKTLGKWWWPILWLYEKCTHRGANANFFIHDADRNYALEHFGLNPAKCMTMTYGIEWDKRPDAEVHQRCGRELGKKFGIKEDQFLLFNGAFNYFPNLEALRIIIELIHPLLRSAGAFPIRSLYVAGTYQNHSAKCRRAAALRRIC